MLMVKVHIYLLFAPCIVFISKRIFSSGRSQALSQKSQQLSVELFYNILKLQSKHYNEVGCERFRCPCILEKEWSIYRVVPKKCSMCKLE